MRKRTAFLVAAAAAGLLALPAIASAAPVAQLPGNQMLREGDAGAQVAILQSDLEALGIPAGPIDGDFGPLTRGAVVQLQASSGLGRSGFVGATTWNAIHQRLSWHYRIENGGLGAAVLEPGDVGSAVLAMQRQLAEAGLRPGPLNGVFLWQTGRALMAFQRAQGVPVTENLDAATVAALRGRVQSGSGSRTSGQTGTVTGGASGGGTQQGQSGNGDSGTQASSGGHEIDGHTVLQTMHLVATAYAPTLKDNYPYGPVDYYGNPLVAGDVAVDPNVIPLGSLLWVSGYISPNLPAGGFLARAVDTGGAIKGMRIDIFINQSEQTVSLFGIQNVTAYLLAK